MHAPTPTDEPCTVPALLVATFPLDPSRRHVAQGALTEAVLDHAADVYARLAHGRAAAGHDALALVPTGLAAGALDAALRDRIVDRLTRTPLLVSAAPVDDGGLVVPERAVALAGSSVHDPGALAALGRRVAALVVLPTGRESQARAVGVEIRSLADVVEDLPAASDGGWVDLYEALALLADDPQSREALGAVPVPLADGRVVRGARGTVVLDPGLVERLGERALETLGRWGVRVVDPAAAHPVLERLGAQAPDALGLLTHDMVRQAVVELSDDESEADDVVDTVLALVGATEGTTLPSDALPWLGLLPLPAADGDRTPADSLVLPGSPAAQLLDDRVLGTVSADAVDRWGARGAHRGRGPRRPGPGPGPRRPRGPGVAAGRRDGLGDAGRAVAGRLGRLPQPPGGAARSRGVRGGGGGGRRPGRRRPGGVAAGCSDASRGSRRCAGRSSTRCAVSRRPWRRRTRRGGCASGPSWASGGRSPSGTV